MDGDEGFDVARPPQEAMDDVARFLRDVGIVNPMLEGTVERDGPNVLLHHGSTETRILATSTDDGTHIDVEQSGGSALQQRRRWLYALGLVGTVIAWALAVYNDDPARDALGPLASLAIFFSALLILVIVLYVVDRSTEQRMSRALLRLEQAARGDLAGALHHASSDVRRHAAAVNGLLVYFVGTILVYVIFAILLAEAPNSSAIDEGLTVATLRPAFLYPVLPAIIAGVAYDRVMQRNQVARLRLVHPELDEN